MKQRGPCSECHSRPAVSRGMCHTCDQRTRLHEDPAYRARQKAATARYRLAHPKPRTGRPRTVFVDIQRAKELLSAIDENGHPYNQLRVAKIMGVCVQVLRSRLLESSGYVFCRRHVLKTEPKTMGAFLLRKAFARTSASRKAFAKELGCANEVLSRLFVARVPWLPWAILMRDRFGIPVDAWLQPWKPDHRLRSSKDAPAQQ